MELFLSQVGPILSREHMTYGRERGVERVSYFVGVAVLPLARQRVSYALVSKIDCPFKMRDVSGSPFGNAISGKEGRGRILSSLGRNFRRDTWDWEIEFRLATRVAKSSFGRHSRLMEASRLSYETSVAISLLSS